MKGKKTKSIHELHLNEMAPEFEVRTTSGVLRLSDYRGRWVVLFAHAADFTPVCTSEIVRLAMKYKRFRALNCEIIALSVDSKYTHMAWLQSIKEDHGIDVPFPMIGDQGRQVANVYGLVRSDTSKNCTGRSTVLIDNKGRLRMLQHYPISVGRSVNEILRVLQASQIADKEGVVLPEGWRPGEALMHPPAEIAGKRAKRSASSATEWLSSIKGEITSRFH